MRATALDQKANEVAAALREREQAAAAELTSARTEAESVRAAARQEMEQARKNVEIVARDMRAQAERWAEEHRATASSEVARLVGLRDVAAPRATAALARTCWPRVRPAERPPPEPPTAARPRNARTARRRDQPYSAPTG